MKPQSVTRSDIPGLGKTAQRMGRQKPSGFPSVPAAGRRRHSWALWNSTIFPLRVGRFCFRPALRSKIAVRGSPNKLVLLSDCGDQHVCRNESDLSRADFRRGRIHFEATSDSEDLVPPNTHTGCSPAGEPFFPSEVSEKAALLSVRIVHLCDDFGPEL
jgi:hypothetical protein